MFKTMIAALALLSTGCLQGETTVCVDVDSFSGTLISSEHVALAAERAGMRVACDDDAAVNVSWREGRAPHNPAAVAHAWDERGEVVVWGGSDYAPKFLGETESPCLDDLIVSTLEHEFRHILGEEHSEDPTSIMFFQFQDHDPKGWGYVCSK